jgi:hypothetical protein
MMIPVLLGSVLSLAFFSVVLAAEIRGGDQARIRDLGILVGILTLVTAYAGHEVIADNWPQIASVSALIFGG